MENLWIKAHQFILNSQIGQYYETSEGKISVIKRTPKRVYFSNGVIVTISKSKHGFYHFTGKNVNQTLRDIEGYFIYMIHNYYSLR